MFGMNVPHLDDIKCYRLKKVYDNFNTCKGVSDIVQTYIIAPANTCH